MNTFTKTAAETYTISIEFSGKLPTGAALASGTVASRDERATTFDNAVIDSTAVSVSGTQARVKVKEGTDGTDYRIRFTMTLNNADVLQEDVIMQVRG